MGRIFKRGETYWADYTDSAGGRQRHTLRTKDRKVAKERLRSAELGAPGGAAHATKFLNEAIGDMLELKREQTQLAYKAKALHLVRVLGGDCDINSITRAQVAEYCVLRKTEKARPHTIHKELVVLRQALKEARKRDQYHGTLDVVPQWSADYVPKRRWLTPAEFAQLMNEAGVRVRSTANRTRQTWLMVQVYGSANKGEAARVSWAGVDWAQNTLRIPGTKRTSRDRVVPMALALRSWLEAQDRSQPLVEPWSHVNQWLRETCLKLGLAHVSTNDLRRTFGSWLKQAGVDSLTIAHMMGHKSPTMVNLVYGQLSQATYDGAIALMPGFGAPKQLGPGEGQPDRPPRPSGGGL